MKTILTVGVLLLAQLVNAHFHLEYPPWRGDSFTLPASQYIYPCANINQTAATAANRTLWPLDGGSIVIDFHHPFTYVWMNLGLGNETSAFNVSLTPMPLNETGNGTLCFPRFPIPAGTPIEEGTDATLQVITVGDSGSALYNCADIKFSSNATLLSGDACKNDTGVSISYLGQQVNGSLVSPSSSSGPTGSESGTAASSTPSGAASAAVDLRQASIFAGVISVIVVFSYGFEL